MAAAPSDAAAVNGKPSVFLQDMEEVKVVFNRFDVNGDGKISSTELTGVMKALGSDTSPEETSRMMEEIDTDRDEFINLEEFAGFIKNSNNNADNGGGIKELEEAFQMYDLNKNGLISSSELHHLRDFVNLNTKSVYILSSLSVMHHGSSVRDSMLSFLSCSWVIS